jgi:hypothetical protein
MKPGGAGLAGIAFGVGNDVSIGVDLLIGGPIGRT